MRKFSNARGETSRQSEAERLLDADLAALPTAAFVDGLDSVLSLVPVVTLVGFLRSGLDARAMLGKQLADRGLSQDGKWVGFDEATRQFLAAFPATGEQVSA